MGNKKEGKRRIRKVPSRERQAVGRGLSLKRYGLLFAFVLLVLLTPLFLLTLKKPQPAEAGWFNDAWSYRARIPIANSSGSDQTDFQVQLTLDTSTPIAAGKMESDCADLRFTSQGGSILSHWLEPGTCNNASSVVWVKVPTVPNGGGQIYVYYGNPSATNLSKASNVFIEVISGVIGAWDLDDNVSGNAQTLTDASGNSLDATTYYGTNTTGMDCTVSGQFGYGCDFDGADDGITISTDTVLDDFLTGGGTIMAWVNADSAGEASAGRIINPQNGDYRLLLTSDASQLRLRFVRQYSSTDGNWTSADGASEFDVDTWNLIAITYNDSSPSNAPQFYLNGQAVGYDTTSSPDGSKTSYASRNVNWGTNLNFGDGTNTFDGTLDNLRMYNRSLTDAEIANLYGTAGDRQGYVTTNYPGYELVRQYNTSVSMGTVDSEEIGPGPVVYLKFDEFADDTCPDGAADACDSSGHGNDFKRAGTGTRYGPETCLSGSCYFYDGTGDYVWRADDTDFDFGAGESFTISTWVRHGTISAKETIAGRQNNSAGYEMYFASDGDLACGIDDDSTSFPEDEATSTTASYADNQWHHVVCVKNANTSLDLYVDGFLVGSDSSISSTGSLGNSRNNNLGMSGDSTNAYTGFIDEFKIYRYARTADQVKQDYLAGAASAGSVAVLGRSSSEALSEGLVGYWPMDESSGTAVADESGNGNDGTLTGAQETGTATSDANTTDTIVRYASGTTLSSNDDAYNGMILYITDDAGCGLRFFKCKKKERSKKH